MTTVDIAAALLYY
jgi:hypothetical protein